MPDEKPKTVRVRAIAYHTAFGNEYQAGDEYDIPEDYVETVRAQGKAIRVQNATAVVEDGRTNRKDLRAKS